MAKMRKDNIMGASSSDINSNRKKSSKKSKTPSKEVIRDKRDLPEPKATIATTEAQYEAIVRLLWDGTGPCGTIRANKTIATIIQVEANTGLRIGDVCDLRLNDIIRDGLRYRFNMRESKTGKIRTFTVPDPVYHMLEKYAKHNEIDPEEKLFKIGVRDVQRKLAQVTDYLGYHHISTHSFRKRFATRAYEYCRDATLVCKLLQHSNPQVTMRYIGIEDERIEKTLKKVTKVIASY